MYIKYGSFQFEPWEASLTGVSLQRRYSPRGFRETFISQMFVTGDVVANGQYDVDDRIADIEAAMSSDGFDFGLYHDDNSPTQHYMQSSHPANLTGNQVFMKNFPAQVGGEYITGRQFSFGVKAEFADYGSSLLEYVDTYRAIGDCGPIIDWDNTRFGILVTQQSPNSFQHAIHSGYAKTTVPWFAPPPPYYSRPFYLGHIRDISYQSPSDRFPQGSSGYVTRWTYHYRLPIDVFNVPTVR